MDSTENSVMSVGDTDQSVSEASSQVADPLKAMQNDLHSRGAELSKAWTCLFSLLTKYQAELTVKENQIEIAERQLETRKQQQSMLNDHFTSPDNSVKLQEQLNQKELDLSRCQQELMNTSEIVTRVQADLSSHMQQLEQARREQLQSHEKMLNYQSEIVKLKSELQLKQEEVHIKDNLVQKLQNQLVQETSDLNSEIVRLKESVESHMRELNQERRSHEQTKKSIRGLQQKSRAGASSHPNVIEIPDSPPTLDLSVEQHDFGLSNIISMSEQQPMEQDSHSMQLQHRSHSQETVGTPPLTLQSPARRSPVNRLGNIQSDSTDRWRNSSASVSQPASSTASDTFFPLSMSAMDASLEQSNLSVKSDPGSLGDPVPVSGPIPGASAHQPTNDSDTGQSQSPVPFHISCSDDYDGDESERTIFKRMIIEHDSSGKTSEIVIDASVSVESKMLPAFKCDDCGECFPSKLVLSQHRSVHTGVVKRFKCPDCGWAFAQFAHLKRHSMIHSGELPYRCDECGRGWNRRYKLKDHKCAAQSDKTVVTPEIDPVQCQSSLMMSETGDTTSEASSNTVNQSEPIGQESAKASTPNLKEPCLCPECGKLFSCQSTMKSHRKIHTGIKTHVCELCGLSFIHSQTLKRHSLVHTGELPFKCEKCGKAWNRKYRIKNHKCTGI